MTLELDRQKLVEDHLVLARTLARRYQGLGLEFDDLVQEASLGLMEASESYDPVNHPGVPFGFHARPYMVRKIADAIRYAGATTVPPKVAQAAVRCRRARSALRDRGCLKPTAAQIAAETGFQEVDVELALSLPRGRKPAELAELPAPMPDQNTERAANELWSAAEILDPDDRELIADRYGLGGRAAQGLYEMCARRNMPMGTLKRRLDQIRKRLKLELVRRGWRDRTKPKMAQPQLNIG